VYLGSNSRTLSPSLFGRMSDDELTGIPGILHRYSILSDYHGADFSRLPACTITPSRGYRKRTVQDRLGWWISARSHAGALRRSLHLLRFHTGMALRCHRPMGVVWHRRNHLCCSAVIQPIYRSSEAHSPHWRPIHADWLPRYELLVLRLLWIWRCIILSAPILRLHTGR